LVISGGARARLITVVRTGLVASQHLARQFIFPKRERAAGIALHLMDVGGALRAIAKLQFMPPHLALARRFAFDAIRLTNNCSSS
jgi:hypothetical protein